MVAAHTPLLLALLASIVWPSNSQPQSSPIPLADAQAAFDLARTLSDADSGHPWGIPFFGPILLVDPAKREVVANQERDQISVPYLPPPAKSGYHYVQ